MSNNKKNTQNKNSSEKYSFVVNGHTYYRCMVHGTSLTAKTLDELEYKRKRQIRIDKLKSQGNYIADITIGDFATDWYEEKAKEITDGASRPYAYCVAYIKESIGDIRLIDSTPQLLEDCVKNFANTKSELTGRYPSEKYVKHLTSVLIQIFKKARNHLVIPWNYAEAIEVKGKVENPNAHRCLEIEEQIRVLEFEHPMRLFACFLMLGGLIPSEACALKWKDLNYDEKTNTYSVEIKNTVELSSNKASRLRIDTTKTKFRKRVVPLPSIINDLIEQEKAKSKKSDWIFPNNSGNLMSASSLKSKWKTYILDMDIKYSGKKNKFDPTRSEDEKKLSINRFTPYDLRHTYATALADNNKETNNIILATLMGHSDIRTMFKEYVDRSKLVTSEAVENLNINYKDMINKVENKGS